VKLFNLFGKKAAPEPVQAEAPPQEPDLGPYAGMRVEVSTLDGRFLFIAMLEAPRKDGAELRLYSKPPIAPEEPIQAQIRGYNDQERKAVYLKGAIMPISEKIWDVTEMVVEQIKNDRAFFRLATDLEATLTSFGSFNGGEKPARLLNVSVGGAGVRCREEYQEGDKLLLKTRLLEDVPESVLYCQVLRIIKKEDGQFDYGFKFLGMTNEDQDKITQQIFTAQRQQRGRG